MRIFCLTVLLTSLCHVPNASAHYLWVTVEEQGGDHGTANIIFEEGPIARDGEYIDHFTKSSKTWFRTVEEFEPQLLEPEEVRTEGKRWLRAQLPAGGPRSVDCYGKFGVYKYGKTNVLLHYYARFLDAADHDALHELGRAEHMDLDIVPHESQGDMELTLLWKGKPIADRLVYIYGPKRFRKNLTTSDRGQVRFTPEAAGRYTFRTHVEQATPGREGAQDYELVRHHATLIMKIDP